jgi:formate dehydrogenase major subunit
VKLVPAELVPADERPTRLPDGADHRPPAGALAHRQHDAPRDRARRAGPEATASLSGADLARLGLQAGDRITVRSRRGEVRCVRGATTAPPPAACSSLRLLEAAANLLTNAALDPLGKIPEFKYCAVSIRPADATSP